MDDSQARQNQIRQQIRQSSKDEFILKEMKRLGFWPEEGEMPQLSEQLIHRRAELRREIGELSKQNKQFENKEALLNKYKKERLRKSKEQQRLNKQRRQEEKEQKQEARRLELQSDITYLGRRFSHLLKQKESDLNRLNQNNLPQISNIQALANHLNISVNELRFLSFDRKLTEKSHYVSYGIKKKSGGIRKISAPKPRLKAAQKAILDKILTPIGVSMYAHGFNSGKSIVSNAKPHLGADIVVNMDLKDFFPTLDFKRVYGFYKSLGFSGQISNVLALICTIPVEEKILVHGQVRYLHRNERFLPQGAPSSPMLTNLICRRMDQRMAGIAHKLGFVYTRYADDMTFSGSESARLHIQKLKWQVKSVVMDEDFVLHPDKTKVMPNGHRKEVTGIVVNEKLSIPRKKLKAFRALLYQIEKDGIDGKKWGDPKVNIIDSISGFARYIHMVDPVKGKIFLKQVDAIERKHRPKPKRLFSQNKNKRNGKKPWWKFW